MEPLAPNEVLGYVVHRLSVAGGNSRVEFDDPAVHRLHQLSGGVQRTINLLCERALTLGCEASARVIDARLVDTAADELSVVQPVARSQIVLRGVAVALALCVLTLVGAEGALWVFRERAARAAVQWAQVPRAPAGPAVDFPTPLTPILAPDPDPTLTAPTNKF
jgi:general secretion pathway protein A